MQLKQKWNISVISAVIVTLAGVIIGVSVHGCKKDAMRGDTQQSASLEDKLYKQTEIAFQSYRDGNFEIYVMNADGSEPRRLTYESAFDQYPSLSSDGKKVAFQSQRDGDKNTEVYIINTDGSEETRLTDNPAYDAFPSWSPDGKKIAFASERDGNMNIYVMNADGSEQTRVTNNPGHDVMPSWSPDGNMEIYIINADGTEETRLTNNPGRDVMASFSPDGKKIVFSSGRDEGNGTYVMNADGSKQTWLSNELSHSMAPTWSPDGKKIVFYSFSIVKNESQESDKEEEQLVWWKYNAEIFVMNADGSKPKNITNNPAYDGYPSWSP